MRVSRIVIFCTMFVFTVLRCFYFDWYRPLEMWDEATNISVINETIRHTSIAVLWKNNKPFFEKPPFWYSAGSFLTLTTPLSQVISLRLFSALSGTLIICVVCLFAYKTWGILAGITSWAVLISTNHLFVSNIPDVFSTHTFQSADGDALFLLFIVCSGFLSLGLRHSRRAAIGSGIFTGFAVITKSPLGFIPLIVETFLMFTSKNNKNSSKNVMLAWFVTLLIFFCWFIPMCILFTYEFVHEYVAYHVVKRAIIPIEQHSESLWFYVELLFSKRVFLFMEIYIISAITILRSNRLFKDRTLLFVWYCSICFLLIPTLIQTKLSWYIFPFYPFAALTISGALSHYLNFSRFSDKRV